MKLPNRKDSIYVPMCLFLDYLGKERVNRIIKYHNAICEFYSWLKGGDWKNCKGI